jgi:flagellar biosynthesis/type III secretory pathway protein FliH
VRIININAGRNEALARKCRILGEYIAFVAKVREYGRSMDDKEEAFKAAIRYCRTHDILKEFLEENAAEVFNMLITEWNLDDAKKVWFEEGREEGFVEGQEEGFEKGAQNTRLEILTLMEQAENMEDFRRLQAQLKGTGGSTWTAQF